MDKQDSSRDKSNREISQHKQSEERVRMLSNIVEYSDDAIIGKTLDGTILSWNKAAEKMYGYSRADAEGRNIHIIVPPEKIDELFNIFKKIKHEEIIKHFETQRRKKDGSRIDVSLTISPVKDGTGNIVGFSTISRDITERKKMEKEVADAYVGLEDKVRERTKELQQSEEKLRASFFYARSLLEASLDPLVTISREGKITDVNEATIKITGISREKLIGTDFSGYFTEPEKARGGYQQVFTEGSVSNYPLTIRHKDGKPIDVLYNATVYRDTKGNVLGVFAAARDVTELKHLQDKLARAEKLAIVGQLASSVAHELRNPLGVMKNAVYYLNMLKSGKGNPEIKENLDIIAGEIENSDKVISDLLEFSRIKNPALRPEEINLIIKETLNRVRAPAGIKVVTQLGEDLPQVQVDALQMQQVFYNLAINAIQAMEKGGSLTIKTGLKDDLIEVSFIDSGCGIPKENLQKIFEPLFSTRTKGTGLGLSVVTSLVEGHDGKIEIESEIGKGSIFTVKLPVR